MEQWFCTRNAKGRDQEVGFGIEVNRMGQAYDNMFRTWASIKCQYNYSIYAPNRRTQRRVCHRSGDIHTLRGRHVAKLNSGSW